MKDINVYVRHKGQEFRMIGKGKCNILVFGCGFTYDALVIKWLKPAILCVVLNASLLQYRQLRNKVNQALRAEANYWKNRRRYKRKLAR